MPTEKEKMLAGELYDPLDPELVQATGKWLNAYPSACAKTAGQLRPNPQLYLPLEHDSRATRKHSRGE